MLPLPRFRFETPRHLSDALATLASGNRGTAADHGDVAARRGPVLPMAGGTDLLPNLKHDLFAPEAIVDLTRLGEARLRGVRDEKDGLHLGALTPLSEAAGDALLGAYYPALARGYSLVASPQIRNMGTVGGNLCLDTRCTYYNQTAFWRESLGYCLKREGTRCHVVPGGTRCVAASSSDGATLLTALGAEAHIESADGDRWVAVEKFFVGEGRRNLHLEAHELVTEVRLPRPAAGLTMGYEKLRPRNAIDFPILSVAVALERDPSGACKSLRLVVAALGSKPRLVAGLDGVIGKPLDEEAMKRIGEAAYKQCHPLTNITVDPDWRHEMVPVYVRRALRAATSSHGKETR
ncbi:MAG TPA: FAD binding domain-containing protein [Candidatus Eisenbacteria bacterium]|nr:FAD binding domain-containing protein [Candidatus Eisenbacteria bacterium]